MSEARQLQVLVRARFPSFFLHVRPVANAIPVVGS